MELLFSITIEMLVKTHKVRVSVVLQWFPILECWLRWSAWSLILPRLGPGCGENP